MLLMFPTCSLKLNNDEDIFVIESYWRQITDVREHCWTVFLFVYSAYRCLKQLNKPSLWAPQSINFCTVTKSTLPLITRPLYASRVNTGIYLNLLCHWQTQRCICLRLDVWNVCYEKQLPTLKTPGAVLAAALHVMISQFVSVNSLSVDWTLMGAVPCLFSQGPSGQICPTVYPS